MCKDNIFLTIIVPVYKVDYIQLHKCIKSLIEQVDFKTPYEILLVDDGSPDDCGKICDNYAETNKDIIRVIHQENQGLSVVRNNGVDAALGDWVAFVDGDDWVNSNFVSVAEKSINTAPEDADILIWDGFSESKAGSETIAFMDTTSDEIIVFDEHNKSELIDRIIPRYVNKADIERCANIGITWGRIYRKKMLLDNGVNNVPGLKVMQDSIFNLWAIEASRKITYQFIPVYHYSMYDESVSKKYDGSISKTMLELYHHFSDYIKKCHNEEEYWQRLYIKTVRLLVKCLAKDYANPHNNNSLRDRCIKMKQDLNEKEFKTALLHCDSSGQEFKFRVILFLLKHKLYLLSIATSTAFGTLRRLKRKVS